MRVIVRSDFREVGLELDGSLHPTLTAKKTYFVIGVDRENYRVIDDLGDPCLFPKQIFDVLDNSIPQGWRMSDKYEDAYYLDPAELSVPGLYENLMLSDADGKAKLNARRALRDSLERMLSVSREPADKVLLERDVQLIKARHPV